ncbi:MAG: helix-turn-helix domain-containing protein [Clostridiales bacterium]|jgi:transcriptional regulator with XRE-family HTH domain|nr:helix-turn-helix domain-containing protein [Clostridiales bacterium]
MDNKKIGLFLAKRRKVLDMTQQQLAGQIGVSNKAISKWETGEGYPDITSIPDLCDALGISADEFFAGAMRKTPGANYIVLDRKPGGSGGGRGKQLYNAFSTGVRKGFNGPWLYLAAIFLTYCFAAFLYVSDYSITYMQYALTFVSGSACLVCGAHYTVKNALSLLFSATAGLSFLVFGALLDFGAGNSCIAAMIYGALTFTGSVGTTIAQRYSFSIKKKERGAIEPAETDRPRMEKIQ